MANSVDPSAIIDGCRTTRLRDWLEQNEDWQKQLYSVGYILFRHFAGINAGTFDAALDMLLRPSLEFEEETSPRSSVGARVFTSTDYPRQYPIQFHHEFSYRRQYPDRVAFCCLTPPARRGATPLADSRKVLAMLSAETVQKFEESGIAYVRNFCGLGVAWQDAFSTGSKNEVSRYCLENNVEFSWSDDDLHTRQITPAVAVHPVTSERAWFNSVLNLNVAGVEPPAVREAIQGLPDSQVPVQTTFGSGEPIGTQILAEIRAAYEAEAVRFPWEEGDLLLIDNVLTAHAREPFEGTRQIIVGMGAALT